MSSEDGVLYLIKNCNKVFVYVLKEILVSSDYMIKEFVLFMVDFFSFLDWN